MIFVPLTDTEKATALWQATLQDTDPRKTFGPKYPTERPRPNEECFAVLDGTVTLGMWGVRWLYSQGTAEIWASLLPEARNKGWGKKLQHARLRYLFGERGAKKVEYGVYTSNPHSIHVSSKSDTMKVEGVLKDHVEVDGVLYDCVLYGITRPEWEALGL
jgi:RimJ/RimL family protein N-acetyltransferase